mmetsp:Transcript_23994/g.51882  ORF Transcript_23994/g.51882 Transcript_23994/m.51882 type:complete len:84 (-) Transcript_23994:459-710(-)
MGYLLEIRAIRNQDQNACAAWMSDFLGILFLRQPADDAPSNLNRLLLSMVALIQIVQTRDFYLVATCSNLSIAENESNAIAMN